MTPAGNCSVCRHPKVDEIDAQLLRGVPPRRIDTWTQQDGNGPRVPYPTLRRHGKHVANPAAGLDATAIPSTPEQSQQARQAAHAANDAAKEATRTVSVARSKANPAYAETVEDLRDDLSALTEMREWSRRVFKGHEDYTKGKKEPSFATARLLAVAAIGLRTAAKTRFDILTGKGKPGEGTSAAQAVKGGLADLLSHAFSEPPPDLPHSTGPMVDLAPNDPQNRQGAPAPTTPGSHPAPAGPEALLPTSEDLWREVLGDPPPEPGPMPAPPPSGTVLPTAPADPPVTPPPTPPPKPERPYGELLTFPVRKVAP